ncbi:MAG: hypothetical protein EP343_31280 [Deltaproteobacteria bacterium]|nr:MAG: hypothetical protein EP343_31280 [Deltaproteobacteria bacterium]
MLAESTSKHTRHIRWQLFAFSGSLLFLELALLRYLAANIWNLGYFPQLVYLAGLLGMGGGLAIAHLLSKGLSRRLLFLGPILLVLLMLWASTYHPNMPGFLESRALLDGQWYTTSLSPHQRTQSQDVRWLVGLFVWIVAIFFCLSQHLGRLYKKLPSLQGYVWQAAGACLGSAAFLGMSALWWPAYTWFLFLIPLLTWLTFSHVESWQRVIIFVCAVGCAGTAATQDGQVHAIAYQSPKHKTYWSPYQKLDFAQLEEGHEQRFFLFSNGLFQQRLSLPHHIPRDYGFLYNKRMQDGKPQYSNVLILGAGVGNDVAAALSLGVEQVDAVEIDPVILKIATQHHPSRPYRDPRVTLHKEDGRTHLSHTHKRYDLILFADPHSVLRHSPLTQLRQENYLFTVESFRQSFERLTSGGELVIYGAFNVPWLQRKLRAMLRKATQREPQVFGQADKQTILMVSRNSPSSARATDQTLSLATDNWPFLYLQSKRLPRPYQIALFTLLGSFLLFVFILGLAPARGSQALEQRLWLTPIIFFGLGAGFVLLQSKGIVQLSLWMGTTWQNHGYIFVGSLFSTWVAALLARYLPAKSIVVFVLGLSLTLALQVTLPTSTITQVTGSSLRLVTALAFLLGPLFFASLLFSSLLRHTSAGSFWIGWNLLGAVVGGALESLSLWKGYAFLSWMAVCVYGAVLVGLLLYLLLSRRKQAHGAP